MPIFVLKLLTRLSLLVTLRNRGESFSCNERYCDFTQMGETNNRVKEDIRITLAIPAGILSAVWIVILSIFL